MSETSIALYLGESYASIGVFDLQTPEKPKVLFEKLVFLPQISLKAVLAQIKSLPVEFFNPADLKNIYVVSRYLDRLKNFRLGGSVAQVVLEGFENAYAVTNTQALSLAATPLIISIPPQIHAQALNQFLTDELDRIQKINPDVNKVVLQLPEDKMQSVDQEVVHHFFKTHEFKIFNCPQPQNLSHVRRTLLNAGSEGTKEEFLNDLKEIASEKTSIYFWINDQFQTTFENAELYSSADDYIAHMARSNKVKYATYFDHETFRVVSTQKNEFWKSPWGTIPLSHPYLKELSPHPFAEVKLDHLSLLTPASTHLIQYEPGPVLAGRGVKPLVIDFFQNQLSQNEFMQGLFPQMNLNAQKTKLQNHFTVLEKGQIENNFSSTKDDIRNLIIEKIINEVNFFTNKQTSLFTGPLQDLVPSTTYKQNIIRAKKFSWPHEIIKTVFQGFIS